MTFHADANAGYIRGENPEEVVCFNCCRPLTGASVRYDGYANDKEGGGMAIHLHTVCASEMGQRLIVDGWPNRRKD